MNKNLVTMGLTLLLLVTVIVGCVPTPAAPPAAQPAGEAGAEQGSVAMILPGTIGDQGWNTKAYLALEQYKSDGLKTAYVDQVPDPDNESHMRSYGEQGFDLVVGHGFTFVDPAMKVAGDFPNTHYFVTAGLPPQDQEIPANVSFMQYKSEEGFYLAGMLAGLMTASNTIAYVGAQATPICLADLAAYKLGAREVNPEVEIMSVWVGAWEDPAKGKEAAFAMIDNGVDVLIHDADLTGTGALQAGKERGVHMIGVIDDQSDIAPELFLTSALVDVTQAIALQVDLIDEGKFGGVWKPGISNGIVGLAPFGPDVTDEMAQTILARQQEIADGSFEVPAIYEEIE